MLEKNSAIFFLNLQNAVNEYESVGGIFRNTKQTIKHNKLHERICMLLVKILEIVTEIFVNEDADELMGKMINDGKVFEIFFSLIKNDDEIFGTSQAA